MAILALSAIDWLARGHLHLPVLGILFAWAAIYLGIALAIERIPEGALRCLSVGAGAASGLGTGAIVLLTGGPRSPFLLAVPLVPLLVAQVEPDDEAPTWAGAATSLACLLLVPARTDRPIRDVAAAAFALLCATAWAIVGLRATRRVRASALAAARLASLGQLVAAITHEIRNPLATAHANVGWLAAQASTLPPAARDAIREAADDAALGLERMRAILDDVRSIARAAPRTGASFRPADAVQEALRLCAAARRPGLRIAVEVDDALPLLRGDRGRIVQVLTNLLANAAEALADTPAPAIRIWARREPGRLRLGVDDNGPGLPPEVRAKLFEPFVTSKDAGLGLGLPLAAQLVREQGGRLEHEALAPGTRFTFALAVAEAEAGAPARRPDRAAA